MTHNLSASIWLLSITLLLCFLTIDSQTVQGECEYGWLDGSSYAPFCYLFNTDLKLDWNGARDSCSMMRADLLSISTQSEWAFISGQARLFWNSKTISFWWYGLNRDDPFRNYWKFSDGTNETYPLSWFTGHPATNKNYAYFIWSGYKYSSMDTENLNFVCKRSKAVVIPCDTENGWANYGTYCYKSKNLPRKWQEARQDCQIDGADLSIVLNQETDDGLLTFSQINKQDTWLGLKSYKLANGGAEFRFWNNSLTNAYKSWERGTPNVDDGQEDNTCVFMKSTSRVPNTWSVTTCDQSKLYSCQKDQGTCAPGWYRFLGKCYYLGLASYDFNQANTFCQSIGAELINLKKNDTQSFLLTYIPNFKTLGYNYLWLGLRQRDSGSDLEWTTGGKVSSGFQNWAQMQPNLKASQADCARLNTDSSEAQWSIADDCLEKNAFICEIPLHKLPQQVTTTAPTLSCDVGWRLYESMCYYFNNSGSDWITAKNTCKFQNAALIDVRTSREQGFIKNYYTYRDRWIGLNNRVNENSYVWNDESSAIAPGDFTYWGPNQPDSINNKANCIFIRSSDARWTNAECAFYKAFICKKFANRNGMTPSPPPTLITPRWSAKCGLNWESDPFSNYCYMFNAHTLSWQDASTDCQHYGGQLVSITSENEKRFIAGRLSSMTNVIGFWTGLQSLRGIGYWNWYDYSPVSYLNWSPGKPTNNAGSCALIYQQNLQWDEQTCQSRYGFICKKIGIVASTTSPPPTVSPTPPPGYIWGCPSGFSFYPTTGFCYAVFNASVDFTTAQQNCRKSGSDLASLLSSWENNYVYTMARRVIGTNKKVWIGLYDSIKNSATKNFMWTDGSSVTYTVWAQYEPNNVGMNEDCVHLTTNIYTSWSDVRCDTIPDGYACKSKRLPVLEPPIKEILVGCPSQTNFDRTNNGACYKFVKGSTPVTWDTARSTCQSYGAELTTILNSDEQAFIGGGIKDFDLTNDDAWFGLYRNNFYWYWSSGGMLSSIFTHWAKISDRYQARGLVHTNSTHLGLWNMNKTDFMLKNFVCKARQDIPTTTAKPTTFDPSRCVTGWIEDGEGFCYKGYSVQQDRSLKYKTWMDARAFCLSLGGDLASIHNETLNNLLKSQMTSERSFWIGLNMRDTRVNGEGHIWSNGQGLNYENWAPGQPDDHNGAEDCVIINYNSMKWSDEVCESTQNWICKVKREIQPTGSPPTPSPPLSSCIGSPGWVSYNDSCYYFNAQFASSWTTARRMCIYRGGDLASINDINENKMLLTQVNTYTYQEVWIGLHELGVDAAWQWVNDDPVAFTNWAQGEPNNWGGAEHCVTFSTRSGYWNDNHCDRSFPYICKKSNGTTTRKPIPPYTNAPGYCPQYFHEMGNKCVRLFNQKTDLSTWTEARDKCNALGKATSRRTYLTSVANQFETGVISSLLLSSEVSIWIGAYRLESRGWQFVWLDNSEFRYTNWAVNEPNGRNSGENCVELYQDQFKVGTWNDINCAEKKGYACATFKDANLATAWPSPGLRQCPDGWVAYMQACYYYEKNPRTYTDALLNCQNKKANLVSIHDEYEHQFVFGIMHDADLMYSPSWVGLNDLANRGTFAWTDGWPVTYTLWGYLQPQDAVGAGCVAMFPYTQPSGQFYNWRCDRLLNSVCKFTDEARPKPPVENNGGCLDSTWYPYGASCYYLAINRLKPQNVMKTWGDARIDCQQRHVSSDLASIEDKGVQDFLMRKQKELFGISTEREDFWIGLLLQNGGGFGWADKSPLKFINWAPGEPNSVNVSRSEDCVEMYWRDGLWNDQSCRTLNYYICKMPLIAGATLPTTAQSITPSSAVITVKPDVTQGNLGTQPTARPNLVDSLFLSRKNDPLVIGIVVFCVALLLLLAVGMIFYHSRGPFSMFKSSGETTMENVAYVRDDDKVNLDQHRLSSVNFSSSFENPNSRR